MPITQIMQVDETRQWAKMAVPIRDGGDEIPTCRSECGFWVAEAPDHLPVSA